MKKKKFKKINLNIKNFWLEYRNAKSSEKIEGKVWWNEGGHDKYGKK
jgi:hypothetical protein